MYSALTVDVSVFDDSVEEIPIWTGIHVECFWIFFSLLSLKAQLDELRSGSEGVRQTVRGAEEPESGLREEILRRVQGIQQGRDHPGRRRRFVSPLVLVGEKS